MSESRSLDIGALLDAVEAAAPVEAVEVLADELAAMLDAEDVSFLIADLSGDALVRFASPPPGYGRLGDEEVDHVPLDNSPYGRAIRSQQVCVEPEHGRSRVYAPVTERGDALGALELVLPEAPDADTVAFIASAAHALAYVVIAGHRRTDLFERGLRSSPFSLEAEIQHRLLPASYTVEGSGFTVAGWLEPANDIAGDTFDYSTERRLLHLSLSDAMGHGLDAAQLATLAVSSLRNSRRSNVSLVEQARTASEAVARNADDFEEYVAALLARVDLATGQVTAVNAGHPNPYLVRDGRVTTVDLAPDMPLGMFPDAEYRQQSLQLQPGDRLVLVTDGMLERNAATLDITGGLEQMVGLHPREVVHRLARAVLHETGGELQDDATVLCVDWYEPAPVDNPRAARAGARTDRASRARQ